MSKFGPGIEASPDLKFKITTHNPPYVAPVLWSVAAKCVPRCYIVSLEYHFEPFVFYPRAREACDSLESINFLRVAIRISAVE